MSDRSAGYRPAARKHCSTRSIRTWPRIRLNRHRAGFTHFLVRLTVHTTECFDATAAVTAPALAPLVPNYKFY